MPDVNEVEQEIREIIDNSGLGSVEACELLTKLANEQTSGRDKFIPPDAEAKRQREREAKDAADADTKAQADKASRDAAAGLPKERTAGQADDKRDTQTKPAS